MLMPEGASCWGTCVIEPTHHTLHEALKHVRHMHAEPTQCQCPPFLYLPHNSKLLVGTHCGTDCGQPLREDTQHGSNRYESES